MNPSVKHYKSKRQNNMKKRNKDKKRWVRNDIPDKTTDNPPNACERDTVAESPQLSTKRARREEEPLTKVTAGNNELPNSATLKLTSAASTKVSGTNHFKTLAARAVLEALTRVRGQLHTVRSQVMSLSNKELGKCLRECVSSADLALKDNASAESDAPTSQRSTRESSQSSANTIGSIKKLIEDVQSVDDSFLQSDVSGLLDMTKDDWSWNDNAFVEINIKYIMFCSAGATGLNRTYKYEAMKQRMRYIMQNNPRCGREYNLLKQRFGTLVHLALKDRAKFEFGASDDEDAEKKKEQDSKLTKLITSWTRVHRDAMKQAEVYAAFFWFCDSNPKTLPANLDWGAISTQKVSAYKRIKQLMQIYPEKVDVPVFILGILEEQDKKSTPVTKAEDEETTSEDGEDATAADYDSYASDESGSSSAESSTTESDDKESIQSLEG
jgi:hypothetical protein